MTQGLSEAAIGATEFGLGALNDRIAVAATGQTTPLAAQSPNRGLLGGISPIVLLGGAALLIFFLMKK
jgi:hypothetical protein